jgi:hypothetical protein
LTQVLAGQPSGSGDYLNPDGSLNNRGTHTVQGGWVALDNFMTKIYDAPPSDTVTAAPVNPRNYETNFEDEVDITGQSLGLHELEPLTSFTVWLGYTDVGTAQANGFTKTNADMLGYISSIKIGSSSLVIIPEPGIATLSLAAVAGMLLRRKRNRGSI